MSVSLSRILPHLVASDKNHDGKFSRKEIANAALGNTNEKEPTIAGTPEYGFLYTLVAGGKNRCGLLPDMDGDHQLSIRELLDLAKQDGKEDEFSPNDFVLGFGDAADNKRVDTRRSFRQLERIADCDISDREEEAIDEEFPDLGPETEHLLRHAEHMMRHHQNRGDRQNQYRHDSPYGRGERYGRDRQDSQDGSMGQMLQMFMTMFEIMMTMMNRQRY